MKDHEVELLLRHRDGQADAGQSAKVNELLRRDPEARAMLRSLAVQATAMADLAATLRIQSPPQRPLLPVSASRWKAMRPWLSAAAMVMLLGIVIPQELRREPAVLTLMVVHGAVSWTNDHGELQSDLADGAVLRAGTLATENDEAVAEARFADGTRLMLGGGTRLTFSDSGQKRLMLHEGTFTAEVKPQPAQRPMLVRTTTAAMEVLGTVFTLGNTADQTLLNVDQGRVQLKRLVDGGTAQVTADQSVRASIDNAASLKVEPQPESSFHWRTDLTSPPEGWKGTWLPQDGTTPNRMAAVPRLVGNGVNPSSATHYCVMVGYLGQRLAQIRPESVVNVRYRTRQPATLRVFVNLCVDHRWAGNFEQAVSSNEHPADKDGWRQASVRFADMQRMIVQPRDLPPQADVMMMFLSSYERAVGLEVAEISITSQP
jgi:ferric-dicitrate binding protein FerR (iron transport regulator)